MPSGRKNAAGEGVEGCLGCLLLVVIGIAVFVGCDFGGSHDDAAPHDTARPSSAAPVARWRPEADDDETSTWVGERTTVPVTSNDTAVDAEGTRMDDLDARVSHHFTTKDTIVRVVTGPRHGSAAVSGADVAYTPEAGFSGDDEFEYTVALNGRTSKAKVSVKVEYRPGEGPEDSSSGAARRRSDDSGRSSDDLDRPSGDSGRSSGGGSEDSGESPENAGSGQGAGKGGATYYRNCAAARAAGAAPVHRGEPGYGSHLDRDGDGIGCEGRRR
ncbi:MULTISPECIES: excalibur calcium-binding domain-containing protein [Streptomyces]|uniref:excalibur calcium-binding domain-containing protein n=1 Tax=Streptomyces TaxID=1883 RepID=UPI00163D3C6A|nr:MULTISPECIES: excalibur calcium-binding domain-containing protein [Streptomyces]MBC2878604.1 excalibur calcium-binding domain-containing protein [Streptomyces sp. TYQ1024]UBI35260.1 excalibur calcium-binding domain-containing protein [Streptomyces mobaraensis]UKW27850.1 excalibur calcium-binding domain-containing protein [Streptomyces sp. TYQ1024]